MLDDFSAIWHNAPATYVRDAVWGDIPLYREELALIDTPTFQRLRGIRQLGPLAWVFPGANHTRFEHALGVMHLARVLIMHLRRQPGFPDVRPEDVRVLVAAALLHDVGHYPFSHALEEVERPAPLPDHAEAGAALARGPLAMVLADVWQVEVDRVAALIEGTGHHAPTVTASVDRLWRMAISGAVDVDRLDFLRRDALFANVPYGLVDVQRILASLTIWTGDGAPRLVLTEKGIGPLQSLVFGRVMMYGNVYWHHTGRIITQMVVRAVEDALVRGALGADELVAMDDSSLLTRLRSAPPDSMAATLVHRIERRILYKRAIELRPTDPLFAEIQRIAELPGGRRRAEETVRHWAADILGRRIAEDDLWLDFAQTRSFTPIEGVLCATPPPGYRNPVPWEAVSGLTSDDLWRLARSAQRVRVLATDKPLARAVAQAFETQRDRLRDALAPVVV